MLVAWPGHLSMTGVHCSQLPRQHLLHRLQLSLKLAPRPRTAQLAARDCPKSHDQGESQPCGRRPTLHHQVQITQLARLRRVPQHSLPAAMRMRLKSSEPSSIAADAGHVTG